MGWSITLGATRRDVIAQQTRTQMSADGTRRWQFPKHCIRGNCLWKIEVVEDLKDGEWVEARRVIALDLLASDGDGWGYKDMDETMGPYYWSCPISYLDMVPCPDHESARKWRAKVREQHKEKQALKAMIRGMKEGDTLYLKQGCRPPFLVLLKKRPLLGHYHGQTFRVPRRMIDTAKTRLHLGSAETQ